ncbi:MAG: thioesterase family protein [Acidimicrobiia bacterium]|nr:MAG: thioesterase family protein [Acidimicrobiia bacterium]
MIEPGLSAAISFTTDETSTAIALRSGDVAVLGTPKVVALIEEAAVAALAGQLPDESTTVGTHIAIDHLKATPVGETVVATATVSAVQGRVITITATVTEGDAVVAKATHTRFIVDRKTFQDSVT